MADMGGGVAPAYDEVRRRFTIIAALTLTTCQSTARPAFKPGDAHASAIACLDGAIGLMQTRALFRRRVKCPPVDPARAFCWLCAAF